MPGNKRNEPGAEAGREVVLVGDTKAGQHKTLGRSWIGLVECLRAWECFIRRNLDFAIFRETRVQPIL